MTADPDHLASKLRAGNRRTLAKAITLVESTRADHRAAAVALLQLVLPHAGQAIRIGISGAPGVGKSTFIEAFGQHVIAAGHRIAVLSVDPSSGVSGGSILGDKTRMESLARNSAAFIRPSPSGGTLGGVARRTREAMLLCEAAGFDVVIIETVGVGQSETAVADMVDIFVLLVQPGGGDELQGIKRGIMELADLVLVNKADGELLPAARRAAADYRLALGLMQPRSPVPRRGGKHEGDGKTPVQLCSALTGEGIPKAWECVHSQHEKLTSSGALAARRAQQAGAWMWHELSESVLTAFKEHPEVGKRLPALEAEVTAGRLPPTVAAQELLTLFLKEEGPAS